MAVTVKSQDDINFGVAGSAVRITHVRFRRGRDDGQPVVIALPQPVNIAVNRGMVITSGSFSIKYRSAPLGNTHMDALVKLYWQERLSDPKGTVMEVDLMTSSTQVVTVSGYSQQQYHNWLFGTEAD